MPKDFKVMSAVTIVDKKTINQLKKSTLLAYNLLHRI